MLCPICAKPFDNLFAQEGDYRWVSCLHCKTAWVDPRPSEDAISKIYQCETGATFHRSAEMAEVYEKDLEARYRYKIIGDLLKPPVLEIGCGAGFFLKHLKKCGIKASGIELSDTLVEFGKKKLGVDVKYAKLDEIDGMFGSLVLFNVLSHFTNPLEDIRCLGERLETGGTMIIETGNLAEVKPELRPKLGAPDHLYHFTTNGVSSLLEKAGLKIIRLVKLDVSLQLGLLKLLGKISGEKTKVTSANQSISRQIKDRSLRCFVKKVIISLLLRSRFSFRVNTAKPSTLIIIAQK